MRILPPLNGLRAFEAAARKGSFAAAADDLGVTPGAISQQVKQLEAWLGLELFDRRPQSLALTEPARAYASVLSQVLDMVEGATRRLRARPASRVLGIAMPPGFAVGWMLPRLERFRAGHQAAGREGAGREGVDIRLIGTNRLVTPGTDGVDAAIRHGRAGWTDGLAFHLFADRVVPVCSPGYRGRMGDRGPVLLETLTEPDLWRDWEAAAEPQPRALGQAGRRLCFGDAGLAVQAAVSGLGVALADQHLIEGDLEAGRLVLAEAVEAWCRGTAWFLVLPAGDPDPALIALRDWLLDETIGPMP